MMASGNSVVNTIVSKGVLLTCEAKERHFFNKTILVNIVF